MLIPKWIISPSRLHEENQLIGRKSAEVVLTISIKEETKRLIKNGFNFGLRRKSVVYFYEADSRDICYKYCDIGHDKLGIYRIRERL